MLRIVPDSNIFISGNMWKGPSYEILEFWKNGKIEIFTSIAIMEEVRTVLLTKFQRSEKDANEFINLILSNAIIVETISKIDVIKEDKEDNKILEAAVTSNANYIITGDKHLKKLGEFRGIKIVPPAEMVKIIKEKSQP